jgi:Txe/YoeB family toxin of Txe-Axe toxin-antitoxin module
MIHSIAGKYYFIKEDLMNLSKRFGAVICGVTLLLATDGYAWPVLDFNEIIPLGREVSSTLKSVQDLNQQLTEVEQETKAIGNGISTISSFMPDLGNASSEEESSDAVDAIEENTSAVNTANDDVVDVISETISGQEEVTNDWVSETGDDVDFEAIEEEYQQLLEQFNNVVDVALNTLYEISEEDKQTLLDLKNTIESTDEISPEDKENLLSRVDDLIEQLSQNTDLNIETVEKIKENYNGEYAQEIADKLNNYKNLYDLYKSGELNDEELQKAREELMESISNGFDVEKANAIVDEVKSQRNSLMNDVKSIQEGIVVAVNKNESWEN